MAMRCSQDLSNCFQAVLCVYQLIVSSNRIGRTCGNGFHGVFESFFKLNKMLALFWHAGRREMATLGETLEMFGARIDGKAVDAMPIRR